MRERQAKLMKIPTTPSVRKADASLDMKLNPVELGSNEIVSWGVAFPRLVPGTSRQVAETATSPGTKIWRTDATIGSVLGTAGRTATPSSD
jgi:hypothetical protein